MGQRCIKAFCRYKVPRHQGRDRLGPEVVVTTQKVAYAILILGWLDRACRVHNETTGAHDCRRRVQQLILQESEFGDVGWTSPPTQVGPLGQNSETRARSIYEDPVGTHVAEDSDEIGRVGRVKLYGVATECEHAPPRGIEPSAARIDRDQPTPVLHPVAAVRQLATRSCAGVQHDFVWAWIENTYDKPGRLVLHGHAAVSEETLFDHSLDAVHAQEFVQVRRLSYVNTDAFEACPDLVGIGNQRVNPQ